MYVLNHQCLRVVFLLVVIFSPYANAGECCDCVLTGHVSDLRVIAGKSQVYQVFRLRGSERWYAALSGNGRFALLNDYNVSLKGTCNLNQQVEPVIVDLYPEATMVDILRVHPKGLFHGIPKSPIKQ